jgi:hypothetical protein
VIRRRAGDAWPFRCIGRVEEIVMRIIAPVIAGLSILVCVSGAAACGDSPDPEPPPVVLKRDTAGEGIPTPDDDREPSVPYSGGASGEVRFEPPHRPAGCPPECRPQQLPR